MEHPLNFLGFSPKTAFHHIAEVSHSHDQGVRGVSPSPQIEPM